MTHLNFRKYNILLLSCGAIATLVMFFYAMLFGHLNANFWIFRCDASLYSNEYYLSYCDDPAYGHYEHGAIFLEVDKGSIAHLKSAQILLLGNSRAQLAFSSNAIREFFNVKDLRFYNLAFNAEFDVFPKKIIEKLDLKPRVIIVNADYFFYNSINHVAKKVTSSLPGTKFEYALKAWVQPFHKEICGKEEHFLKGLICGNEYTQFRSRINGMVTSANWPNLKAPINYSEAFPEKEFPVLLENAREFKKFVDKRNACLILTVVPSLFVSPRVGRKIAEDLGVSFIRPEVENLRGNDVGHLNPASAEVWSLAFLKEFKNAFYKCP